MCPAGALFMIPWFFACIGVGVGKSKSEELDFEAAMAELEALVQRLEEGDLPLEDMLRQFERGVALTRRCQGALREAEQKVQLLSGSGENADSEPFAGAEEDEGPELG